MILCAAFYAIATLLTNLVGGYLFQAKVSSVTSTARDLAVKLSDDFIRGDMETLHAKAEQYASDLEGRLLIVDMDGKVQLDTSSALNGWRLGHPEVVNVLNGAQSDYGFHQIGSGETEGAALFDFLRNPETNRKWVGYFTEPMAARNGNMVGIVLFSVSVQEIVDQLRSIQDQMLLVFMLAAVAVLVVVIIAFSQIIIKPIAKLTEGIQHMARGELSTRVEVKGKDEIARLSETFNQMSEKLENLDTTRNEFVSNASHELKTPLATMKIMLESMIYQEDMDPALRTEFLGDINKELDRLSNIVTDLLTLVQSDAQEYRPEFTQLMLRDVIEDTIHRLEPLAQEKEHDLDMVAQTAAPIQADPTKIQQAIYNLVDNAIKYTPKGGIVRVLLRQEGKNAIVEVSDNGPGIPKKDQAQIFDRFYRVDRARSRATGGNGLGLSIVHQAVVMHGGSVTVHSEEGKGATFRVELPLAPVNGRSKE